MQNNKYKDFMAQDARVYTSLIDEYRRIKYFTYKSTFVIDNKDILFELLVRCLKHMFKIKRNFIVGIEFGLNVKNVYTLYRLTELDAEKGYIALEWDVDLDKYLLEFQVRHANGSKKAKLIFKQRINRDKTFFGMADYIGIVMYKRAFKSNMKAFCGYINHLIDNGEVPLIITKLATKQAASESQFPEMKKTTTNTKQSTSHVSESKLKETSTKSKPLSKTKQSSKTKKQK